VWLGVEIKNRSIKMDRFHLDFVFLISILVCYKKENGFWKDFTRDPGNVFQLGRTLVFDGFNAIGNNL
jgi:hypothetical protein